MDKKEIEKKVKEILADRLEIDISKIKLDSDLVNDLAMDSFGAVEVMFELKEKFRIDISQSDFSKIEKVKDIVTHLEKRL